MQGEVAKDASFIQFVLFVLICILVEEDTHHNLFAKVKVQDQILTEQ